MKTMTTSSEFRPTSLPKLSTSKGICRRESLSSSRTRDSGYDSDLDVSLSPLDFVIPDPDLPFTYLPTVPESCFDLGVPRDGQLDSHAWRASRHASLASITSNATSTVTTTDLSSCPTPSALDKSSYFPNQGPSIARSEPALSQDEEIEKWIKENLPSRGRHNERLLSIASLSSANSCDMYSNTDISDEEDSSSASLRARFSPSTLKVIDLIMRKIELNLQYAAYKQCTISRRASTQGAIWSSEQQSSQRTPSNTTQKRKSRQEGSPPPEDEDDGPNKRRRGSLATTDGSDTGVRFACPFYKHDPDRYRNKRTCPGPGWQTVHRMKEHLYRSHSQPIFCPICYATFKSDKEQSSHVRLQQCQRSEPQQIEGIDRETVWILRKRTTAMRLEDDKWRDVYHILFPDVPDEEIPSPFYDCDSPSETSRRFRRELLRRVHEELVATADQSAGPVEQRLLHQVADIIRRCEDELLNGAVPPSSSVPALALDRRASNCSAASSMNSSVPTLPKHTPAQPPALVLPEVATSSSAHASTQQDLFPHVHVADGAAFQHSQLIPEPAVDFAEVVWDGHSYATFGAGIDWEAVFPRVGDMQEGGEEVFALMGGPGMYT